MVCATAVLVWTALAVSCRASSCADSYGCWTVTRLGESSDPYMAYTEAFLTVLVREMSLTPLNEFGENTVVRLWFPTLRSIGMVQVEFGSESAVVQTALYSWDWKDWRRDQKLPGESPLDVETRQFGNGWVPITLRRELAAEERSLLWSDLLRSGVWEAEEQIGHATTGGSFRYLETWDGSTYRIIKCIDCIETGQVDCFNSIANRLEQVGSAWILGPRSR